MHTKDLNRNGKTKEKAMLGKILPEIEKHNNVCYENYDIPFYNALLSEKRIQLYFNREGEVWIMAWAGDLYVYWLSKTKVEDTELNAEIFYHIVYEELEYVTELGPALKTAKLEKQELDLLCLAKLDPVPGKYRKKDMLRSWITPFGHRYEKELAAENGAVFAQDIVTYLERLRARCSARECDGSYEAVLKQYAMELEQAEVLDERVQAIKEILEDEEYLILSYNEALRELYRNCRIRCMELTKK